MNCDDYRVAIRAAVDADTALDKATRAHLSTCDECHEDYTDWALERALAHDWVPPPPEGFVDRVIAGAVRERSARVRLYAAAAAIGVLGIAIGLLVGLRFAPGARDNATDAVVASVTLVAHQGKTVRLLIDSEAAHDGATVTVELADNLELAGFPNERRIEWQTQLAAGRNLLTLPLMLTQPSDSQFRVGLKYGSGHQDIRVSVKSEPNGFKA